MPGLTLTLAAASPTNYNLLTLITAKAGYSQTKINCSELTLLGDPGNGAGKIFEGGADVSSTNFGQQLIGEQSTTRRSAPINAIALNGIWVATDTPGSKVEVDWDYA